MERQSRGRKDDGLGFLMSHCSAQLRYTRDYTVTLDETLVCRHLDNNSDSQPTTSYDSIF